MQLAQDARQGMDREAIYARAALVALVLLKLAAVVLIPPLHQNDSFGYITFAETIRSSPDWATNRPVTMGEDAYRMIGYPALIAGAMKLFGSSWGRAVVIAQMLVGVLATVMIYRFARAALGVGWLALLVAGGYAASQALLFELHILTDGLYAHLIAIVISALGLAAINRHAKLTHFALVGGLLGVAFLIREFTFFLLPVFVPLIVLAVFFGFDRFGGRTFGLALVLLPVIFLNFGYSAWNQARTGSAFVTTGARTAALLPLVQLEGRGTPVFGQETVLDEAARRHLSTYFYEDVLNINRDLAARGVSGVEMSRLARDRYVATLIAHPLAFVRHVLGELRLERRAKTLANPPASFRAIAGFHLADGPQGFTKWSKDVVASKQPLRLSALAAEVAAILLLFAIGGLAYFVFPIWYLTRSATRRETPVLLHVLAAAWLTYAGTALAYSLIRLEDRYLIGPAPFMVTIGLFTLTQIAPGVRRWSLRSLRRRQVV